ncbi:LysM peptidoglycan-binding domain-containing protein [Robertmurraya yapensis]|uniref:LysM peptidoglycan-binding domain-containing protein n=1 Tax=Bacillus yapensis TaxID=2492960 RepID=A0A431WEF8_9BACI|nr:LysM peptidoglycan-binding domain-containing protein [Bacillus yapensis]RTR33930.1 LysM peptidoglycan-binding domain-containing protein [Bacillus yapensis]TKS97248.1 LysM peptidoglycan-binding domain-containing protein [Bacillus yapensis]
MQMFYTVRAGDTLFQIAQRWGIPLDSLVTANNIVNPNAIFVGQQLSLPPGVDRYRVQAGDTLWRIAQFYGVPISEIATSNQIQPPYTIFPDQLLTIPRGVPYYFVQPGDTLFQIARRYNVITGGNVNYQLIMQANNLTSTTIIPGQRLVIPYAPPGEDGLLAYISNRSGSYDLWLYNPSNDTNRQVTFGLGESYSVPYWSPDSNRIAFIGKNGILYVVNMTNNTFVAIDQYSEPEGQHLNWAPDNRRLVYSNRNEIVIYDVVNHQVQRINHPNARDVQWLPSGQELLFTAPDATGTSQIYRIRTDGTGLQQVTQNTEGAMNFVRLSPDGRYVLYAGPGASISIIYAVELATGRVFQVPGGPLSKNYNPTWSPNSTSIAYSATSNAEQGYFSQIRTSGRQGENDRTWAISDCFVTPVTWSPDSRRIAYLSDCNEEGGANEIWMLNLDHPVPIQLVTDGNITALVWSHTTLPTETTTYTSTRYQVQLQYPAHWQKATDGRERYEGADGFFQVGAIAYDGPLGDVCQSDAYHQLRPYGSNPQIVSSQIQGQPACMILPSADQPPQMQNQAAVIVQYPTPVVINNNTYRFFILWADVGHINQITATLRFL